MSKILVRREYLIHYSRFFIREVIMEKGKLSLFELKSGSIKEKIDKTIKYIQENAASISLVVTTVVAVGSMVIKIIYYLMDYGYSLYFRIPQSSIDVSKGNLFYGFLVNGIIALFCILMNLIPYFIWKGNKKVIVKLGWSFLLVLMFPNILLGIGMLIDLFNGITYSVIEIIHFLIVGLLLGFAFFFCGFYFEILKCWSRKKKNTLETKTKKESKTLTNSQKLFRFVIFMAILLLLESFVFILYGYSKACSKNEFKIIENPDNTTYTVLYETSENYIITKCTIKDKTISFVDLDTKQEINKTGIEYSVEKLTQV